MAIVTLSIDGGLPQPLSLSFDRSDVPYTVHGHPRQFGFRFDASAVLRAAVQDGAGLTGSRKFTFELVSAGNKVCTHAEVLQLGPAPKPVRDVPKAAPALDPSPAPVVALPQLAPHAGARPRMLVVSWDMGHNPAGRAYLLADIARRDFDVKLIGPLFKQYGTKLWEPLEGQSAVEIETFPGGNLAEYLKAMVEQVERNPADVVYVSKPRLSSLLFGFLMRVRHNATLVVDVDDHELSFYKNDTPAWPGGGLARGQGQSGRR